MKETPYELLKDDQKKKLGKKNEAKMTLYNALPRNSQVKNCKIDLLTQEYEKFSISNEETIDSGFTRFNAIVTSLKYFDPDYSSKNHVRKFLRALPLKWRAKVMAIEEAKDMATLSLDKLIENVKFDKCKVKTQGGESLRRERGRYNCGNKNHLADNCLKPKNKEFARITWSDSEDGDEPRNDATCLIAINFQEQMNDGIFFNQSKYIGEMLKKFGLENSKVTKTSMSRKRVLTLDKDNESIDNTKYREMIGSLLYLTTSRPDIMFSVCLCARFQEDPKVSHLEAIKRIFRTKSNSEGSMNKGEMGESSKKSKRKFKTMKEYEGDERIMFEFILRGFMEKQMPNQKNVLNPLMIEKWKALKPWIVDLKRPFNKINKIFLSHDLEEFLSRSVVGRCKFPWCNDIVIDRSFWHGLCGHDDNRKGWLLDEHIDLWVTYMWHTRQCDMDWAMVSCYFLTLLLQGSIPLFYVNNEIYPVAWSNVERVFIPINKPKCHWSLAMFHICSGSVIFYDNEETHDKEFRPWYLKIMKCLEEEILVVLKETGVFEKKIIDQAKYKISFRHADYVPKQGGVFGDCDLAYGVPLAVDDPVQTALAYREKLILFYFQHKILCP
ncbi:phospholipase-like protein [Tanacetum coccineum]